MQPELSSAITPHNCLSIQQLPRAPYYGSVGGTGFCRIGFIVANRPWAPLQRSRSVSLRAIVSHSFDLFDGSSSTSPLSASLPASQLQEDIKHWLSVTPTAWDYGISSSSELLSADREPTKDEIALLQNAFASFYGTGIRDADKSVELLSQAIHVWEETHQSGDEIAALYRVRADAFMELRQPQKAEMDYSKSLEYLDGPDGEKADPEERTASRIGRARAVRSMGTSATPSQALQASNDYEMYFVTISRLDAEDNEINLRSGRNDEKINAFQFSNSIMDGIQRNPYAAWEWGMVNRVAGKYDAAAEIHHLAANAFDLIGDKPRAVICRLDGGLDLVSGLKDGSSEETVSQIVNALKDAIDSTVGVDGRDVELLQRVVVKEGEARIALSGVLWDLNEKPDAEAQFGEACGRLDELNLDYQSREQKKLKKGNVSPSRIAKLRFSIDDILGSDETSCSRFRNEKFIEEKLVWPKTLQSKVERFLTLSK